MQSNRSRSTRSTDSDREPFELVPLEPPKQSKRPRMPIHKGDNSPYLIPEDDRLRVINFSGGRSSAYMLNAILAAHSDRQPPSQPLPDNVIVCFANTGKERPETLDFVQRCSDEWGVDIVWLEYHYRPDQKGGRKNLKHYYRIVDHETASRDGRPFEDLILASSILPNVDMRKCTSELKVQTINRYVRFELGWDGTLLTHMLGIRADEQRRVNMALFEECKSEYPMVYALVTQEQIQRFWKFNEFDLGIPSERGNCDLCFLKGAGNLLQTAQERPDLVQWWIDQENKVRKLAVKRGLGKHEMARFSKRFSYQGLLDYAQAQGGLEIEAFVEADEPGVDCFCGD